MTPKINNVKQQRSPLKVLFVAAEIAPFISAGGLGQVSYFLPRALLKKGIDIRLFMPKFAKIDEKQYPTEMIIKGLPVPTGSSQDNPLICNVKRFKKKTKRSPEVYFLENMEYYEKRANVYNYADDHIRFGLLSRGALEFILASDWVPDIIHTNDWHTGYLPNFLRTSYGKKKKLKKVACAFSIHNLQHQGNFDFRHASDLDFDDGKGSLAPFFDERFQKQNPVKRAIIYADIVNTVSHTYSREIMSEEYGVGLHNLIKELRTKIFGIQNGLDTEEFNPRTDKIIKKNYGLKNLDDRIINKIDLQKEFALPVNPDIPLIAMSGRIDSQKGIDLVMKVLPCLLEEFPIQFVILGGGPHYYRDFFADLEKRFPKQVGTHLMPNFSLPRKIFAGSDILMMPSRFEPGGIVAVEGMRYGAVPLVRATGGLADSVVDFDPKTNTGYGFVFKRFNEWAFFAALIRALEVYKNPDVWRGIIKRAMSKDFSWDKVADNYVDLYSRAIRWRKKSLKANPHMAYRRGY